MRTANWRWFVALCLPLAMAAGGRQLSQLGTAPSASNLNTALVPLQLGDWRGDDTPVSAEELARLDRTAELRRGYGKPSGEKLSIAVVYSGNWKGLHSAESCLTGAGWAIVRQEQVSVLTAGGAAPGTALVTRDKQGRQMVEVYMFVNRRGVTANWIDQFWMLIKNRGRGEIACHFILNQRVPAGDTAEKSISTLVAFAQDMLPFVRQSLGA